MKIKIKQMKVAILAIFTLSIFGCDHGIIPDTDPIGVPQTFVIRAGGASDKTKSGYDSDGKFIYWTSGDKIGVFVAGDNNNKNKEFTQVSGSLSDDAQEVEFAGTFTGIVSGDERTIYACYPYNSSKSSINGNVLTIDFPASQTHNSSHNFSDLPAVGKYTGNVDNISITFRNMWTVIKLPLRAAQVGGAYPKLTAITFKANDGSKVAGPMSVDMSQGDGTSFTPVYTGLNADVITLSANSVELNGTAKDFYIAVPSKNYASGYTITIKTDRGDHEINTADAKDFSTKLNKILVSSTISVIPTLALRFARSNIVWDATNNKLTFAVTAEDNKTIPANSQGVLFQWGSLVAISPATLASQTRGTRDYKAGKASTGAGHIVYSPTGTYTYAWTSIPYISSTAAPFNNEVKTEDDFATYNANRGFNAATGIGDICRYISSQNGWVSGKWRLPTAAEYNQLCAELPNGVSNNGGFNSITVTPNNASKTYHYGYYQPLSGRWLGAGVPASGNSETNPSVGVYFPAGGHRHSTAGLANFVGDRGHSWSGSSSSTSAGYYLYVPSYTVYENGALRQLAYPVRCIRAE